MNIHRWLRERVRGARGRAPSPSVASRQLKLTRMGVCPDDGGSLGRRLVHLRLVRLSSRPFVVSIQPEQRPLFPGQKILAIRPATPRDIRHRGVS